MMIAHSAVQYVGVESMLHMTCVGSTKENVSGYLEKAKGLGLRNILALRGDLPNIDEEWQYDPEKFNYGTDLVRHIRQTTGDYFTICVAGCHPSIDADDNKNLEIQTFLQVIQPAILKLRAMKRISSTSGSIHLIEK